jgi:hypothetical protein
LFILCTSIDWTVILELSPAIRRQTITKLFWRHYDKYGIAAI